MRFLLLLIVSATFFGCASSSREIEKKDYEVSILKPIEDSYEDCLKVKILERGDYEMLVPFSALTENAWFYSHKDYDSAANRQNYLKFADSIISKCKESNITTIELSLRKSFPNGVHISKFDIFRSGKYYIYNKKNQKYIEKVRIKEFSCYRGPLAAAFNFEVFINDIIFFGHYVQA